MSEAVEPHILGLTARSGLVPPIRLDLLDRALRIIEAMPSLLVLRVPTIIEVFKANGGSIAETAAHWEVDPWVVETAVRYYADNREEIDDWIARVDELNEREDARWRAAQEAIAVAGASAR